MDALCEKIQAEGQPPHERIAALEGLTRELERRINETSAPSRVRPELEEWHMAHFDACAGERLVVQKATVSTGMLLFANACRDLLRTDEGAWREGEHPTIASLVPEWVERGIIPEFGEPILFMSARRVFACLRAVQAAWYTEPLRPADARRLLHWLTCRIALLITYPFDGETFNEGEYRQRFGDTGLYLASLALVFDAYALVAPMQRDLWRLKQINAYPQPGVPTVAPRPLDEARAWRFMDGLMGKVQGDNLCTQFQKSFIHARVRLGDALIFARRRPSAIAPTHMDLIAENHGVAYSRETHAKADVRLVDVYREEEYHEVLWLVVIDYYFRQKIAYPWLETRVDHRIAPPGEPCYPRVLHIPVENAFAVEYAPGRSVRYGSVLQAILRWARAVPPVMTHRNARYDASEIIAQLI